MCQLAGAASVLGEFKEMGLLGWLLVDAALNIGGWAVAAVLKVRRNGCEARLLWFA
jgi:hypothetical protein